MITLYNGDVPLSAMGCRIKTIAECYKGIADSVALYKSDNGAVLCRFGSSLLMTELCDKDELRQFCAVFGIEQIETEASIDISLDGFKAECYPLLYCDCKGEGEVSFLPSLKCCYDTVCAADSSFAAETEYLYWLSDITRRQNKGLAKAYFDNGAAATVTALSNGCGYLSLVASMPNERRKGRASAVIKTVLEDKFLYGKRLFTAAQNYDLIKFYQKNGFSLTGKHIVIFKKEKQR